MDTIQAHSVPLSRRIIERRHVARGEILLLSENVNRMEAVGNACDLRILTRQQSWSTTVAHGSRGGRRRDLFVAKGRRKGTTHEICL